ncbi:ewing's tumor-associated antigen 1 homolog [Polyodon spathula]|uniref:ewing's tumor-associated antigen 1 homolog n=1 Tax=Polyodon spathula TaxID=7913 RepID=UPI001B7DA74C|nr:ewing's tumor-associated antigen 1 homolog [Polyodon spathula]
MRLIVKPPVPLASLSPPPGASSATCDTVPEVSATSSSTTYDSGGNMIDPSLLGMLDVQLRLALIESRLFAFQNQAAKYPASTRDVAGAEVIASKKVALSDKNLGPGHQFADQANQLLCGFPHAVRVPLQHLVNRGTKRALGRRHGSGGRFIIVGQAALNVHVVILQAPFLVGKQLPRAFPPIAWNGNSSSSGEEKEKQRKTVKTVSCFPGCVVHGTETRGEDADTTLTEVDGEERSAGVRDAKRSVQLWERRFSSVCLEKGAQNSQKLQFASLSLVCFSPAAFKGLKAKTCTKRPPSYSLVLFPGTSTMTVFSILLTPKRYLRTSHHTSSSTVSPCSCNDNELHFQQDIFWDPASPPARFGKGENKLAVSGHAVEISDLVNRIAPKDEKPAGPEVPLLEMWIGDSAIPCTPRVLRAKPKKNSFRSSGVEDLMKLAKQFDRNMIQQGGEQYHDKNLDNIFQHENEDQMESDMHEKGLPPLGELTGMKKMSSFNSKNAGTQEEIQIKNSSQKSVDQEAEADINALFDAPTQLLSGRLSQNSSKSSFSSPERNGLFGAETNNVAKSTYKGDVNFKFNKTPGFEIKLNSYQNTTEQCAIKHTTVSSSKPPINRAELASKSSVSSVSTDDFDDDWSSDLLDDSFVSEITQNPKLIATPKRTHCCKQTGANITQNNQCVSREKTNKCIEHGSSVSSMLHSGLTGKESRQHGIDMNPGEFQRKNNAFEKVRNRTTFVLQKNLQVQAGETSVENISKQTAFCASNKPEPQKDLHQQNLYKNETRFNKGSPSTPSKNTHNFQQVQSVKSAGSTDKTFNQQSATSCDSMYRTSKPVYPHVKCQQVRVEAPKQTTFSVDDCSESRFSDGVLINAVDECDSLWGDVDDDDLFYQVCDDVDKLAEAQSTGLSTNIMSSSVKRNNSQPVTYPNKMKSGPAPSAVRGMSAQSSYAAPENRYQNRSVGNATNKPPATINQANSVPTTFGNDSPINATSSLNQKTYTLNANSDQSVFVPSINNNKSDTSKYVFTKLRSTEVSKEQCSKMTRLASGNITYKQSYDKGTVQSHPSSSGITGASSKRHLSGSIALTSSKVFVTNHRTVKCSQEEIEKKKQEALARRRMRIQTSLQNGAPV